MYDIAATNCTEITLKSLPAYTHDVKIQPERDKIQIKTQIKIKLVCLLQYTTFFALAVLSGFVLSLSLFKFADSLNMKVADN